MAQQGEDLLFDPETPQRRAARDAKRAHENGLPGAELGEKEREWYAE